MVISTIILNVYTLTGNITPRIRLTKCVTISSIEGINNTSPYKPTILLRSTQTASIFRSEFLSPSPFQKKPVYKILVLYMTYVSSITPTLRKSFFVRCSVIIKLLLYNTTIVTQSLDSLVCWKLIPERPIHQRLKYIRFRL